MISNRAILDMDATQIAKRISNGTLTSKQAVQAYISHINKINSSLNAVVESRFEQAIAEAIQVDEQVPQPKKVLFGVPISVKESYHVSGMKTTGGLLGRQDLIMKKDADIVKKLKMAGAIVLGKTNTPELCFSQETENKLYGRTNNAWNVAHTAGGSSGGEGALLGVGGSAVGIGSDIGGSIRFPSHFNGVIGFKPGKFQVSTNGHFPPTVHPLQERMIGLGPMGKSVRDMERIYNVIANFPINTIDVDTFSVDFLSNDSGFPLSIDTKTWLDKVKNELQKSFPTSEAIPPYFEQSSLLWQEIMSIDGGKSIRKIAFASDRGNPFIDFAKEKINGNSQTHPYLSWALIGARLFKPSAKRINKITRILYFGDKVLNDYLQRRLLIFPVYHTSAPKHGKTFSEIFSIRKTYLNYMPYIAYANVWGLPALTIPVGTNHHGMPISLQIMSKNGNEAAVFYVGRMIESAFRGYIRNSGLD